MIVMIGGADFAVNWLLIKKIIGLGGKKYPIENVFLIRQILFVVNAVCGLVY